MAIQHLHFSSSSSPLHLSQTHVAVATPPFPAAVHRRDPPNPVALPCSTPNSPSHRSHHKREILSDGIWWGQRQRFGGVTPMAALKGVGVVGKRKIVYELDKEIKGVTAMVVVKGVGVVENAEEKCCSSGTRERDR
ncbi:hypothetical protein RIF29_40334 [Crotalaria pallida]|uniref:Uncharacterized protein n=1 Tax=Crotalaria pallida TaxID=3830 RepID=A0AAN9E2Z5_CROPI